MKCFHFVTLSNISSNQQSTQTCLITIKLHFLESFFFFSYIKSWFTYFEKLYCQDIFVKIGSKYTELNSLIT